MVPLPYAVTPCTVDEAFTVIVLFGNGAGVGFATDVEPLVLVTLVYDVKLAPLLAVPYPAVRDGSCILVVSAYAKDVSSVGNMMMQKTTDKAIIARALNCIDVKCTWLHIRVCT